MSRTEGETIATVFHACGHCGTKSTMPIKACGRYRLCVVCTSCAMHKKVATSTEGHEPAPRKDTKP